MNDLKELRDAGVFVGILVGLFIILFFIQIPAGMSWQTKNAVVLQSVLDTNSENVLHVENPVSVVTPLQDSLSLYTLSGSKDAMYGCIVRITGMCGPVLAVFICKENGLVDFLGVANSKEVRKGADCWKGAGLSYTHIKMWKKKLSIIVGEGIDE